MGLDMYLKRITRLTDDDKKLVETYQEKSWNYGIEEFALTNLDGSNTYEKELNDIMPYGYVIDVPKKYWNEERLKKHFKIPNDARLVSKVSSYMGESWEYRLFDGGKQKYAKIDLNKINDIKDKFIDTHVIKCGYFRISEVAYWRKEYDLDKAICMACDEEVVNCGYHRLNDKMREIILKHEDGKLTSDDIEDTENSIVCYHQWY